MPADLINGLGGEAGFGEQVLDRSDDGTFLVEDISSVFENGLTWGGATYTSFAISTNGTIGFESPLRYWPGSFTGDLVPSIGVFWADAVTTGGPTEPTPGGTSTGSNRVYYDFDTENDRIVITWDDVRPYAHPRDRFNAYQMILSDRGSDDFDIEFRYEAVNWASGATAGYSGGPKSFFDFFSLPASRNNDEMLALDETPGNTGQEGRWLFEIRQPSAGPPTPGDDLVLGTDGDDSVDLLAGNDRFVGGAGNDTVFASTGDDFIIGGDGIDTVDYSAASAAVTVDLGADGQDVGAGLGADQFLFVENLIGSGFNDRLAGDQQDNMLVGGAGNDDLRGRGGEDLLIGGAGNDILRGGTGFDRDTLQGGAGNDLVFGESGNDLLYGDSGADRLYGGRDDDVLFGGAGSDVVSGNRGNDVLEGGEGMDVLRGKDGDDLLDGGADTDYLLGGAGRDILNGGPGSDRLTGGLSVGSPDRERDIFVYADASRGGGGFDRVRDFENGTDLVDLTAFGFDSFAEIEALLRDRPYGLRIAFEYGEVLFLEDMSIADFGPTDVIF